MCLSASKQSTHITDDKSFEQVWHLIAEVLFNSFPHTDRWKDLE